MIGTPVKTDWDYSALADAYLARPGYAEFAVNELFEACLLSEVGDVCDVGAGTGHLTTLLAAQGHDVVAVEPNDRMRENGVRVTADYDNVRWVEGTGEATGMESSSFDLVTFGSSFNVCDQPAALGESARILRSSGWFACMWNHRVLEDPLQSEIESIIRTHVESYDYGTRRHDPTREIERSGLFGDVRHVAGLVTHTQTVQECVTAWRSHATLERQAGDRFGLIVAEIEEVLTEASRGGVVEVPYVTRIWFARRVFECP